MAFSVLECVRIVGDVVSSSGLYILGLLKSYQMKCAILLNSGCLLLDLNSKPPILRRSVQVWTQNYPFLSDVILCNLQTWF